MHSLYLLGHPVAHSLSPRIHNEAAKVLGLDHHYDIIDVLPDALPDTIDRLKKEDCSGFNLTMPLKQTVLPLLDSMSEQAALASSVNTVKLENGKLYGHTTDGDGFFDSLAAKGHDPKGMNILLLGAGGAASSIIVAGAFRELSCINVYRRDNAGFSKTLEFCGNISKKTGARISVKDIADTAELEKDTQSADLIVNATNVGMAPDTDDTILDKRYFHPGKIVYDIIYNPLQTRFLQEAGECGAITFNGTHMLLYQAAGAFKLWTGYDMPVEQIKKVLW